MVIMNCQFFHKTTADHPLVVGENILAYFKHKKYEELFCSSRVRDFWSNNCRIHGLWNVLLISPEQDWKSLLSWFPEGASWLAQDESLDWTSWAGAEWGRSPQPQRYGACLLKGEMKVWVMLSSSLKIITCSVK